MARVLTGIQSAGIPHLGNLLGAIIPAIKMSENSKNESLFFIADLHSFTTIRDKKVLQENTYATAAAWLAFGFDTKKNLFYRQSDVPQVCELTWYLNCFTPFPMLANAHSFKDKSDKLSQVNSGLFTYPVLMAADILLYDAEVVPVGKDQIQHLEITRDIAGAFNHIYNELNKMNGSVYVNNGFNVRDFIHIQDVCSAILLLITNMKSKVYNISTGIGTSIFQLCELFSENLKIKKNSYKIISDSLDDTMLVLNPTSFSNDFSWKPSIDLDSGIKTWINEYREMKNAE